MSPIGTAAVGRRPQDFQRQGLVAADLSVGFVKVGSLHPRSPRPAAQRRGEIMNSRSFLVAALAVGGLVTYLVNLGTSDAAVREVFPARQHEAPDTASKEPGMAIKTAAKGRTEVKVFKPVTYDQPKEGPKLNEVQLAETFMGDIEGEGNARVLQAQWPDGSLRYCTIERVDGALAGRRGSFLLQVEGTVQGKHNKGAWFVIAGSATGGLRGLRGD